MRCMSSTSDDGPGRGSLSASEPAAESTPAHPYADRLAERGVPDGTAEGRPSRLRDLNHRATNLLCSKRNGCWDWSPPHSRMSDTDGPVVGDCPARVVRLPTRSHRG